MQENTELKPRLLATEDNLEEQKFLRFYLRRKFEVDIADSAESFYQMYGQNDYDFLLFDISIRGPKSGLDLIKEIRQSEKGKTIPVVVLTAHAYAGEKEAAENAGADAFLTKPLPRDQLMETLLKVMQVKSGVEL